MLTETWEATDVMREFRKRRDVRPNDYFLEQIVELDNELRKERLFNAPRSIHLHQLKDLNRVPKPWHFEFWDAPPDEDSLPFKLSHFGEIRPDMHRKRLVPPYMNGALSQPILPRQILKNAPNELNKSTSRRDSGEFVPTTDKQLRLICWRVKPWSEKKTSKMFSSQFAVAWKVDCDEVFPNLFIGDAAAASNVKFLKHLNITHVLNTAEGDDEGLVNLESQHFQGSGITYKGFLMWDSAWFDVSPFLDEAADYIAEALESGGKCLVNCQMGVSRSCTCAMAFMMKKNAWSATDVLKQFRSHRDVRPNDGFMRTLVNLDNQLRKHREGFL
ncbi:hypothetical protein TCAL_15167 [Tigriopus californicus]|uniref:Protein-serine/threonine phosphatase n=2 Tax=Tigriopus californicus TaxID=6832 RepID=A0A553NU26_TIGCA|nr:hypothetical protein TCAL_15167 [Tigriopus californicus]